MFDHAWGDGGRKQQSRRLFVVDVHDMWLAGDDVVVERGDIIAGAFLFSRRRSDVDQW
jgi:hypothetical protein